MDGFGLGGVEDLNPKTLSKTLREDPRLSRKFVAVRSIIHPNSGFWRQLNDLQASLNWEGLLGGSWVVISGVISPLIWVITIVTLLITPLITTHELPSRVSRY